MTNREIERSFDAAMVAVYERAKKQAGYTATRYAQMLSELGGLATARRLLGSPDASDGFTALWEAARLDLSVEATVLRPEFAQLFSTRELAAARRKLADYGCDVSAELNDRP